MIRPPTVFWMVLCVVAAFGLYMVKYKVQALRIEVAADERQLREEKRNLHVLTAEWTYLNRPERLQSLTAKYLDLKPTQGRQLTDFASLPYDKPASGVQQASGDEEGNPVPWSLTFASGAGHGQ